MRELFVWYRVRADQVAQAGAAVRAMQQSLRAEVAGLEARLLVRAGTDAAAAQTWMETYACPGLPGGVDPSLEAKIEAHASALAVQIAGGRHTEAFSA